MMYPTLNKHFFYLNVKLLNPALINKIDVFFVQKIDE